LADTLASTAFLAQLALISDNIQAQDISLRFEKEALEAFSVFENCKYHTQLKPLYLFIHAYMVHKDKVQNEKYDAFKKIDFTHDLHSEFLENGYLIIKDFLTPQQVSELKQITHSLAHQELEKESAYLYGNGNKLQRVYNLLNKHQKYRELLVTPTVTGILERVFARDTLHQKYYLSSFQSNILNPGAEAQKLHVDSSVPDPLPPWLIRININFLLDDFTSTNGSTLVAPGSHKFLRKPNIDEQIKLINVIAPAGSIVMWTGHLWHKTSANTSNHSRTALLACFAASYLREVAVEENYLEVMSKETIKTCPRELQNLLGVGHGIKQGAY
jgi:ectoine hydroxylase-related dioxygenase (phytanoyl-CoA dioxygenase family)